MSDLLRLVLYLVFVAVLTLIGRRMNNQKQLLWVAVPIGALTLAIDLLVIH